jgi:hypothetical protein
MGVGSVTSLAPLRDHPVHEVRESQETVITGSNVEPREQVGEDGILVSWSVEIVSLDSAIDATVPAEHHEPVRLTPKQHFADSFVEALQELPSLGRLANLLGHVWIYDNDNL